MRLPCFRQQYPYAVYVPAFSLVFCWLYPRKRSLFQRSHTGCNVITGGTDGYYPSKIGTGCIMLGQWLVTEHMQRNEDEVCYMALFYWLITYIEVRNGLVMLFNLSGFGWSNWHPETEKAVSEQMQNTWPSTVSCYGYETTPSWPQFATNWWPCTMLVLLWKRSGKLVQCGSRKRWRKGYGHDRFFEFADHKTKLIDKSDINKYVDPDILSKDVLGNKEMVLPIVARTTYSLLIYQGPSRLVRRDSWLLSFTPEEN